MIDHLTICVTAPVEAFAHLTEQVQQGFAIGMGKIDILAPTPREVTWYSPPESSMRRGLAMMKNCSSSILFCKT
jgi:hypothetical protein